MQAAHFNVARLGEFAWSQPGAGRRAVRFRLAATQCD